MSPAAARKHAPAHSITDAFGDTGYHMFPAGVDPRASGALLADVRAVRAFDDSLFLTEAEFDADPQYVGVNPRPGRNLLDAYADRLGFVEQSPQIVAGLTELLGEGYEILNRKFVCGVPASAVPAWLKARIEGRPVNNLGAYVRPEFRDVTYFYGIDFHQDLIDYKDRDADFLTLYVYLHPVSERDAPLYLLENSHSLGASVFPHDLSRNGPGFWRYRNGEHGEVLSRQQMLTGPAGFTAMWHACTLHGTQPHQADRARLSLRYLFAKTASGPTGIDAVNAALSGPTRISSTRVDLAEDGSAVMKRNSVNRA
ncbi:MAG: hypothetical protein ABIO39_06215 [Caulobacteraceae bacterium]